MGIRTRIRAIGKSLNIGIAALLLSLVGTLAWVELMQGVFTQNNGTTTFTAAGLTAVHPGTGVSLQANLSQPQIVQGEDGTVYLDLRVVTPDQLEQDVLRLPTDILVILDRSGSMGEGDKWSYATQAVRSLLDRLTPQDRIALITFDSTARREAGFTPANGSNLARLHRLVNRLRPGASTNLGDALLSAERTVSARLTQDRRSRILLLSDGQANVGIVDPEALGVIAKRLADRGSVVSTIGMGLGFNETLMASLADLGMGSFSYLEHLELLGGILAQELADSRLLYADGSEIRLDLPKGVDLIEASGYPFSLDGQTATIRTGQLFQQSEKRFMVTLRVCNQEPAEYSFGALELVYKIRGQSYRQRIKPGGVQVACVAPEKRTEAIASIDKDLYREGWLKNNLGSVMRQVGDFVRKGEQAQAVQFIDSYKRRLQNADDIVPGLKKKADRELRELEGRVDEAFRGRDQKTKQNRTAKSLLGQSQELQRTVEKKNQP